MTSLFTSGPVPTMPFHADGRRSTRTSRRGQRRPRTAASGTRVERRGSAMRLTLTELSLCAVVCISAAATLTSERLFAQAVDGPDLSIELIDPKVLRVCADPHNMPFSTEKGEGFENKLAELLAGQLGKGLAYTWYPQAPGFV